MILQFTKQVTCAPFASHTNLLRQARKDKQDLDRWKCEKKQFIVALLVKAQRLLENGDQYVNKFYSL